MKKLLLASVALSGLAFAAAPAYAGDSSKSNINVEVGGYFKGYGVFHDQDDNADTDSATAGVQSSGEANDFDFIRDTELHIGGETTLDNGLTVGVHFEFEIDKADTEADINESYAYFSGNWGRANFGAEDGASYLLQVAAPAADSNIDGIRQYVAPFNYTAALGDADSTTAGFQDALPGTISLGGHDYAQDPTGKSDKLTYLSPIMNGVQVGASYTPNSANGADYANSFGVRTENVTDVYGESYELAARYEGQFNNVGVIFGAGYAFQELEAEGNTSANVTVANGAVSPGDATDDRHVWNVGLDLDFGAFGLGALYKEDSAGDITISSPTLGAGAVAAVTGDDEETFVIGADYTTGPFKLGASYFDQENTFGIKDLDTTRYTGGVTYEYGPGMTFRGSVSYIEHEAAHIGGQNKNDIDATSFVLGTQINF